MTNPLRTAEDYELFLYSLKEQYPSIRRSTITLKAHLPNSYHIWEWILFFYVSQY